MIWRPLRRTSTHPPKKLLSFPETLVNDKGVWKQTIFSFSSLFRNSAIHQRDHSWRNWVVRKTQRANTELPLLEKGFGTSASVPGVSEGRSQEEFKIPVRVEWWLNCCAWFFHHPSPGAFNMQIGGMQKLWCFYLKDMSSGDSSGLPGRAVFWCEINSC